MPILEYVCEACAHQFEALVRGAQEAECPACHSKKLERRLSVFAVGGHSADFAARESFGPCGTCGDPRGPGACSMN
jgi:putative FmdB family regulatory protein